MVQSSITLHPQTTAGKIALAVAVATVVGSLSYGAHKIYKKLWIKRHEALVEEPEVKA